MLLTLGHWDGQTYDGWDQANYVAKDVKPGKLPVMINSSMGLIVSLFVAANASYFIVLPYSTVIESSTIGLAFGRAIAGPVGGLLFALVVSVSCLGAMNGALFTSAYVSTHSNARRWAVLTGFGVRFRTGD